MDDLVDYAWLRHLRKVNNSDLKRYGGRHKTQTITAMTRYIKNLWHSQKDMHVGGVVQDRPARNKDCGFDYELVERLPEREKQWCYMFLAGWKYSEIGRAYDLTGTAVSYAVRTKLKEIYNDVYVKDYTNETMHVMQGN